METIHSHPQPTNKPARLTVRFGIGVFVAYLVISLVMTYPAVGRLSTELIGDRGDTVQNVWNLWWVKTALVDLGTHPYHCEYLHHPHGANLIFQTMNPFNGLISIPLQSLFSIVTTYNLIVLFSYAMSGLSMFLLVRFLTGSTAGAFVAGLVFVFCPYRMAHTQGHLHLISTEWVPLYLLYLIRALTESGIRNKLLAAFFLLLCFLCSTYYLMFSAFLSVAFVLFLALCDRKSVFTIQFLGRLTGLVALLMIAIAPLLGPMLVAYGTTEFRGSHEPIYGVPQG